MGNPRSAILTAFSGAAVKAGPSHVGHRWAYNQPLKQSGVTHYAGEEKMRVLRSLGIEPDASFLPRVPFPKGKPEAYVGLVPGSRRETRRWPAASYAALGRLIYERLGLRAVVFWGPGERELAREVAEGLGEAGGMSPETRGLRELAGEMTRCRAVITNCNGPKHLAVALGIPTVTIHGSSDPVSWNPPAPDHPFIRVETLKCIGCGLNACPYKLECMTQLSPEAVYAKVAEVLA
jgi:ADP-heptose:LPS heptosyltransferase